MLRPVLLRAGDLGMIDPAARGASKPDEHRKRMSVAVRAVLGNEESAVVGIKERRTKGR